jgi:hypothetical protein
MLRTREVRIREVKEMDKETRKMEMGMAMGAVEMELGKVGEDNLPWLIRTPLHQIRLRIILSRRQLLGVQPRMCSLLRC